MADSLEGLVVGDAFGDQLPLKPEAAATMLEARQLRPPIWPWTDDSNMAFDIVRLLQRSGSIDQDELAQNFADHYDVRRGYGPSVHHILRQIQAGASWRAVATASFDGTGSYGNGGAMRVAPLGVFFADDLDKVVEQARLSAEVTHAHIDGTAGAIAVAIAAAHAYRLRGKSLPDRRSFLDMVIEHVPEGAVHTGLRIARDLPVTTDIKEAAAILGDGRYITAADTVPYTLWCAGTHLDDYEEALWFTLSYSGDRDTNCAIVGGIVAAHTGRAAIPLSWRNSREADAAWFAAG